MSGEQGKPDITFIVFKESKPPALRHIVTSKINDQLGWGWGAPTKDCNRIQQETLHREIAATFK